MRRDLYSEYHQFLIGRLRELMVFAYKQDCCLACTRRKVSFSLYKRTPIKYRLIGGVLFICGKRDNSLKRCCDAHYC
jgi:hypothetical protein